MPKLKESPDAQKNRVTRALIEKNMILTGKTEAELAIATRMDNATLWRKKKDTGMFRVKELRVLCEVLKFTPEEKAQIL